MLKKSFLLDKKSYDISRIPPTVYLGLIVLLGMALRFYNLGTESYWIDEMSTVVEGQQSIQQLFASERLDQPPAYYVPFHYWEKIFGANEVGARSFSVFVGVSSIILIYLIGRELFGNSVGLLSAFFMALSQIQVYYSQQARFYAFFEFSTLLSFLFYTLALRSKRKTYFAFYGVASVLMVLSHTHGLFVVAAQGIFFVLQWKKYRDIILTWFVCQLFVLLALILYFYPLVFGQGGVGGAVDTNIGGLPTPTLLDPLRSVYRFIMPARGERDWVVMLVNYGMAVMLLVVGVWIYAARQGMSVWLDSRRKWLSDLMAVQDLKNKILLVFCWLLFPILLPFVLSVLFQPMYLDRYTVSAAPALYLLLALAVFSIRRMVPVVVSLGVLVVIIAPSLGYYYATDIHEQWREAAAYVGENSSSNDIIVFAPNQGIGIEQKTFNWYYNGTLKSYGLGSELVDPIAISAALKQVVSGHDRLWVIIRENPNSSSDLYTSFFLDPGRPDMHLISERHFVEITVYLFELSK